MIRWTWCLMLVAAAAAFTQSSAATGLGGFLQRPSTYIAERPSRAVQIVQIWQDGREEWFYGGQRHRENGPAIVRPDGSNEWWIGGRLISATTQPQIRIRYSR